MPEIRHRAVQCSHHQSQRGHNGYTAAYSKMTTDGNDNDTPHDDDEFYDGNASTTSAVSGGNSGSQIMTSRSHHLAHSKNNNLDEELGYSSTTASSKTSNNATAKTKKKRGASHHDITDASSSPSSETKPLSLQTSASSTPSSPSKISSSSRSKTLFLKTAFWIITWYSTSLATLFLNKIILSRKGSSVHVLGMCQMTTAAVLGGWSAYYYNGGLSSRGGTAAGPAAGGVSYHFARDMSIVGLLRGLTVVLGLIALEHVPVSFVETIKATAPAFTVLFAKLILKEHTPSPVVLTLIPVVAGLILCSKSELRFDTIGFLAAVTNNCADCVQNVMSKRMLAHLRPTQLQFYTSVAALVLQTPFVLRDVMALMRSSWWKGGHHNLDDDELLYIAMREGMTSNNNMDNTNQEEEQEEMMSLAKLLFIDAIFYHLQSVSAYCTMGCMSPVSQSVANTLKRALLVWASILYFHNPVTSSGIMGIVMVVSGVFLYNHVRRVHQS